MMDFEAQGGNEFDNADFAQAQGEGALPVAGAGDGTVLMPDGQGVVVLPEGVTLEDIQAEGRDLVVLGADGTRYIIPDGGVTVPQIEVDGVAVPPANLAALLLGNQPEPAAGPPQSSGGNFADDVGPLQDAFGLGDLLPYTDLQFAADEEDEVIPDIVDRRPDVSIEPDDSGVSVISAEDMVDEAGLPDRGGEPAGSDSAANSESTFGFINFSSPDGTSQVAINGVAVTEVGQTFSTPFGVLTITSIADGRIGYDYTLTDNTTDSAAEDLFTVTITDRDGDTATATLRISIVDDVPTAADDTDTVPAGSYAAIGGNVITGLGTDSGAAGADTPGADGARVSAVENSSGETVTGSDALVIQGTYGTLTLNADGSYSYQRAPGTPGGSTDTFTYTLTDGDGDTATATLTIEIGDAPATVISVPEVGDGTVVDESGLPVRDGEAPGSAEPTDVETTAGTITFAAPDGVASVSINGVIITGAGQQIQLPEGTLTIVSYDPAGGTLDYSFTLADNTGGDATQVELTVTVTDTDGDSDSEDFVITVIDDTPTAVDDAAAQGAEGAPVVVDAFANDVPGADSVDLVSGVSLVDGTLSGAGTVTYNDDGTFTYTPAQGEEGTVTFDYTITDGDGDTSTATVTITLAGDSTPTIDVIEAQGGALVHEAGLPTGSDAAADSETTTGTFAITTGNDAIGSLVIDGIDVTSGGVVTGDYGTLTVTVSGGAYSYSYTLTTNTAGDATQDVFDVVVTDSDGDSASAPLVIDIVDDVPTAQADTNSVAEGGVVAGDVLSNDELGADGAAPGGAVTGVAAGSDTSTAIAGGLGGAIAGAYGSLTLNANGSYTYVGTPNTVPPAGATDTFVYTITDGDGDTSTVTLKIDLTDSGPPLAASNEDATVDEAALAVGSNPPSGAETVTGTLADNVSGGTGPYTFALLGGGGGSHGTLTLDANGNWSYTLATPVDGTTANDSTNTVNNAETFTYEVTDADGNTTTNTLTIDIIDDVPTAVDDGSAVAPIAVAEDTPLVIDVLGNDVQGADGVADADVALASNAANGTAVYNGDGTFTYTPNAGYAGADSFTYTITDGDGDTSTATVYVEVAADSVPRPAAAVAAVDDDGLAGGNAGADGATDLDADAGDSGAGVGDEAVFVGAFTADFGNDGPHASDAFTLAGMHGTGGTVGAEDVDYSWDGVSNTLTATIDGGPRNGTNLFTVAVNPATGDYTVTLLTNVVHLDDGADDENDATAVLTFTATDDEGDPADGTLTITFDDDVPTAADDGSVATPIAVAEDTATQIGVLANDIQGADGVALGAIALGTQAANGTVVYNGAGTFTYTPNAGYAGADSFTYTITDGDGDTSTATVYVEVAADSVPRPAAAVAAVDDDGLAGGNAGADGATDLDADVGDSGAGVGDEAVFVGAFTADFGNDGPHASDAFTLAGMHGTGGTVGAEDVDYSWDGVSNTLTATIDGGPRNGTNLFTVAVNPATGEYTVTLLTNVAHLAGGAENDAVAVLTFTAIDSENDETDGTLTITFDDDVPTAADDGSLATPFVLAEGTAIQIDVFANDVGGADGVALGAIALGTQAANGTAAYQGDGTFIYTPNAGYSGADSFTYTITDGDGDTSTATVYVEVEADSVPAFDAGNATVDEDGLAGANVDSNPLQVAPAETDSTEDSTDTVSFTVDYGNDTPGDVDAAIAFINPDSLDVQLSSDGQSVDFALDGGDLVGTMDGGATEVIRITLNAGTDNGDGTVDYSYTVTLSQPLDHADDESENTLVLNGVTIQVTDSDGTQTADTFTVTIVDDVPTAVDDANSVTEGLGNATAGNVYGAGGASVDDSADPIGADGAAAGGAVTGVRTGTEAGGGALTAVGAATVINGAYGDLTINPDGTYSYQLTTASIPSGVTSETFTYQITDGDGDTDLAELVIALDQDANAPDAVGDARTVYEDGLADGAEHGADSETVTGSFTVDGNGEDYTLTLDGDAGGPVVIDSVGDTVTTSKGVLTITSISAPDAGGVVTYGYSYTLSAALTHTGQGEINPLTDTITMAVTDATGDSDAAPGSIVISIVDDVPTAVAPVAITSGLINAAGSTMTADLDADGNVADNFGADGPGLITFANVTHGEDSGLTSGGTAITQWLSNDGQTLQGRINSTDGSDGTLVFQIDLDPGASTYTVTMSGSIDNGAGVSFNDLTSVKSGSDDYRGVGADDAATTVDLLISGSSSSGADAKVNTSTQGIGVGAQSIDPGDTVRIDFVSDLTTGAGTPSGFGYTGHVSTTSFIGLASQVQSPLPTKTASFKVWALDTTTTQSDVPDRSPAAPPGEPFSDSSVKTIIEVTVTDGATGNTTTVDISGYLLTGSYAVAYGISIIREEDGSVRFSNVEEGDSFGFKTASGDEFDAIAVQGVQNKFDLGAFSIGTVATGDPVQLSYDLQITDGDGDSVLIPDALDITVTANTVPPVALDLDGDGVEFLGLEAGVAHDYGDGLKATAWVNPDDGLLARDTGTGLDIVFTDDAAGATTDLEGVRLGYDSDGDGLLTANDKEWGSFGVWQDANSDGKVDAGEFTALSDAGIDSIGLVSDGQSYSAAGGDVLVHGTATFTRADGSRGDVADALFVTGEHKAAQRTAEAVATAAAAGALLMPQPVLAHDQLATADGPLQRIDPRLLEMDGPDRAPSADDFALPATSDLLGAEKLQQDEGAGRSVEQPAEDHARPALDAEPATGPGADALGSASEPVADLGGSAFAGFGGDAGGAAIMDALLALQAMAAQPTASVDAAVAEALGEVAGSAAVDAIVDHYADGENTGPATSAGEIDPAVLLQALDGHVFAGNGAVIPDPTDDAAMLAAAVQA